MNSDGQVTERELYGPAVDQVLASEYVSTTDLNEDGTQMAGTVSWMLTDNEGTVRDVAQLSDGSTSVIDHLIYDSFGQLSHQSSSGNQPRFTYTGSYVDPATGLQYNGARWYDPSNGDWISQDPLGYNAGQTNLQAYVYNNPTNYFDPSGMFAEGTNVGFPLTSPSVPHPPFIPLDAPTPKWIPDATPPEDNPDPNQVGIQIINNCFTAGTFVATGTGQTRIETIDVGNEVWAYDLVAESWRPCRVEKTFVHHYDGALVEVRIDQEIIESTASHPYWVVQGQGLENRPQPAHVEDRPAGATTQGRWVDAGHLRESDRLLLRDGRLVPVCSVKQRAFSGTVYG